MIIKLEVGKKYLNRKGELITIKKFDCDAVRFAYQGDDFYFYDVQGICAFNEIPRIIKEAIEPVKKPHKHSELIKLWADGAEIETRNSCHVACPGVGTVYSDWFVITNPAWNSGKQFRIKPASKPDVVFYNHTAIDKTRREYPIDTPWLKNRLDHSNLKLTFDGETGELKSAEVLK